jgi:hypothetical protein
VILLINLIYTGTGILMFRKVGFYALSLLFYGGISSLVEYFKLYTMTWSLNLLKNPIKLEFRKQAPLFKFEKTVIFFTSMLGCYNIK